VVEKTIEAKGEDEEAVIYRRRRTATITVTMAKTTRTKRGIFIGKKFCQRE